MFEAYRYAADGHGGEPGDGEVIATGTFEECRREVAIRVAPEVGTRTFRMGRLCWSGTDDDIEAYHESDEEGCGGWAIRPAR